MPQRLIDGFEKFFEEEYTSHMGTMAELVEKGQDPDFFIISCIDSRSNPGAIFRPAPGTFFAHKAMGAIVRPHKKGTALAAGLQFALDYNNVKQIVILGHTGCGAIKALISGIEDEEIGEFLNVAQEGLEDAQERCGPSCSDNALHRHAEEAILLQSARNLRSYPSVARALEKSQVVIKAWLFDMENGDLLEYSEPDDQFLPLTHHTSSRDVKHAKKN